MISYGESVVVTVTEKIAVLNVCTQIISCSVCFQAVEQLIVQLLLLGVQIHTLMIIIIIIITLLYTIIQCSEVLTIFDKI